MSDLPTCHRLVTALTKETSYGTAIADASLVNMFHLINPELADIGYDLVSNADLIKGHEFDIAGGLSPKIVFRNARIPLTNIPLSAEFLGWMVTRALGAETASQIATSGDWDHVMKMIDKCAVSDQLPSSSIALGFAGSVAVNRKYVGVVVNSFTIRLTDKGRVTADVEFITNGIESDGSGVAIPASFHSSNFYFGINGVTVKYANFGQALVDNTAKFRSFEITVNNNLLVDEAKLRAWSVTDGSITELRLGDRTITAQLKVFANETDQEYIDALALTKKVVEVTVIGPTLSGGNPSTMIITLPEVDWSIADKGFEGTQRVLTLDHNFHMNTAEASPLKIQTTTRDTAYL